VSLPQETGGPQSRRLYVERRRAVLTCLASFPAEGVVFRLLVGFDGAATAVLPGSTSSGSPRASANCRTRSHARPPAGGVSTDGVLEPGDLGFRIKLTLSDSLLRLTGRRSNSINNVDANDWNQEQQDLERTRAAIRRETENLFNEIHDQVLSSFPTLKLYGADSRKGNNILPLANADFFSSSIALPRRNAGRRSSNLKQYSKD
jgi:hypothetical protein